VTPMFSVSYHLETAGWSTATVSDGERSVVLTASYLFDALGDLTRAVIALLRGAEQATLTWHEEPRVAGWRFERQGDDVDVRITLFDNGSSSRVVQARLVKRGRPRHWRVQLSVRTSTAIQRRAAGSEEGVSGRA
jgi:hypothetical protein